MEANSDQASGLLEAITNQLEVVLGYLPTILTVFLILTTGWIVARFARRGVRRIGMASNRWLTAFFPSGIFSGARMSSLAVSLLSEVIFWSILLIALAVAATSAELGSVSQWLDRVTAHLPNLIAGTAIVIVGYFLSVYAREQFLTQSSTSEPSNSPLAARIAQGAVILIALTIGLDQVGIDVTLLIGLLVAISAGVLTAMAVAFALGARTHISNLIGVRTAHVSLSPGMTIQLGDIQGEIVDFTATLIALDTDKGRVLIPGRLTDEAVVTVLSPVSSKDDDDD